MKDILVIGDLHWKKKEPYRSRISQFLKDLYKDHKDKVLIFTGDFFDKANPHSEDEVDEVLDIVLQWEEIHIVSGNHELSNKTGNPLVPLNRIPNLHVYRIPEVVEIQGLKFLMLPYRYNIEEMKLYEKRTDKVDVVVSHCAFPGTNRGAQDELNLSSIQAKWFLYGHIHEPQDFKNHHIIGVPNTTRYGEHTWQKRMALISKNSLTFINLPDYVKFETVKFGDEPVNSEAILNVINAPSIQAVIKKYKSFNLRLEGVTLVEEGENITYNEQKDMLNFSLESNFQEFEKENNFRKPVVNRIKELFTLVPE